MSDSTFITDQQANELIQQYGIASSDVLENTDEDVTLGNGDRLVHHRDLSQPLGWESFASAEPAPAAEQPPVDPSVAAAEAEVAKAAADLEAAQAAAEQPAPLDPAAPPAG